MRIDSIDCGMNWIRCLGVVGRYLIVTGILVACGRALPPVPPEAVSPGPVSNLVVKATPSGVNFTWNGADSDRRGKDLKQMDGYRVYRKELERPSDAEDRDIEFELIGTIPDAHIAELVELREQARLAGKPVHRVRGDPKLNAFQFTDTSMGVGRTYMYLIKPYNQGDVNGAVEQSVRVLFRGEASEVVTMTYTDPNDTGDSWGAESGVTSFIK